MKTVKVNVSNNQIEMESSPMITGNVETIFFDFTFNDAWDGFAKTAVFYTDPDTKYLTLISEDSCPVPAEVLTSVKPVYFGVFGVQDEKRIVTALKVLQLEEGAYGTGTSPSVPSPDIYAQILSAMQACLDETDDTLDEIERMVQDLADAEDERNAAVTAAVEAVDAAVAAVASKQDRWHGSYITLSVSDWAGGTSCVKSVPYVTDSSLIVCDISLPGISCSGQSNGALTFSCTETPTSDALVKAVIFP